MDQKKQLQEIFNKRNLIISDLDGTLFNKEGKITENTRDYVNKLISAGYQFTIATGRNIDEYSSHCSELNISLPIILENGAIIYDPVSKKVIDYNPIDFTIARGILAYLDKNNISAIINSADHLRYHSINNDIVNRIRSWSPDSFVEVNKYADIPTNRMMSINCIDAKQKMNTMAESFRTFSNLDIVEAKELYVPGDYHWTIITSNEATKGNAISKLRTIVGAEKIIGFGDSSNDLSMFKELDYSVAMDNAIPDLKKVANDITLSNGEDGVINYIKESIEEL